MSTTQDNAANKPPRDQIALRREAYNKEIVAYAVTILKNLVGEERAREAAGRIAIAMRQAAMAAPGLYDAQPQAIANAVAMSALTALMPGGLNPKVWLIPKGGSAGGMLWMVSHRGIIELARRAGIEIDIGHVFEGELWSYRRTPFPSIEHVPDDSVEQTYDTLRAVYVLYWPVGKREEWRVYVLGKDDIDRRRQSSDQSNGKTWTTWWREMAAKTAVKAAAARGLLPTDDVMGHALDEEDRPHQVIATIPAEAPRQAGPPKAIATGLDGLEEDYTPPPEPVRVEEPAKASRGSGGKSKAATPKADAGAGAAEPKAAPPKPEDQPIADEDLEEWAAEVVAMEQGVGAEAWAALRKELVIDGHLSAKHIAKHLPAKARRYMEALGAAVNAKSAGGAR